MSQTNMQKIYQLLIFVVLIGLSVSRPNGNADTQVSKQILRINLHSIDCQIWLKKQMWLKATKATWLQIPILCCNQN